MTDRSHFLPTHGPPCESRVRDFRAGASRLSPISGLLSWDRLPTASPVPGSSQDVLFMMLLLCRPGVWLCFSRSATATRSAGALPSFLPHTSWCTWPASPPPLGIALCGSPGGLLSLPSSAGTLLCLGLRHFATPWLSPGLLAGGTSYRPAGAVFGTTPRGLLEPPGHGMLYLPQPCCGFLESRLQD